MEFRREQLKVYAITDRSWLGEQTLAQAVQPQQSSLFSSFIISQYAAFYADDFSLYKQTFTTSASNIIYHEACINHRDQTR